MIHSCGEIQTKLPENPEQWLKNWSKQIHTRVTFVLDHADDILDSNCKEQFLSLLRTVRMLSEQRVTYVITTRKTFKDSEMHVDEDLTRYYPKRQKIFLFLACTTKRSEKN